MFFTASVIAMVFALVLYGVFYYYVIRPIKKLLGM